jgi:hypothetical protein
MPYGEPRVTHDIDIVLELHVPDIPRFCQYFPDPDFYLSEATGHDRTVINRYPCSLLV